ncbi:hypothetical protein [Ensifer adhaerens]|uniref:hypothetical protein n=1 Tax=Ensifer adhaerens TaxID=106592 RepID=UPI00117781E8|nr:hypothetical protein [Ensifer adhaerens]
MALATLFLKPSLMKEFPKTLEEFEHTIGFHISSKISEISNEIPRHDYVQVEFLLRDCSRVLERCLAYRREYLDLDARAVARAAELKLFRLQRPILEAIESQGETQGVFEAENNGYISAETAFRSDVSALGKGFAEAYSGMKGTLQARRGLEESRLQLISQKWQNLAAHEDSIEAKSATTGHSLNYGDRARRVREFLIDDVTEAFLKSKAVNAGLKYLFGTEDSLPAPHSPDGSVNEDYLDELVDWCRRSVRNLETFTDRDIDVRYIVPVIGRRLSESNAKQFVTTVTDAAYKSAFASNSTTNLEIDLTNFFPPQIKKLRLRSVGISVVRADDDKPAGRALRYNAILFPPEIPDPFSVLGGSIARVPVLLTSITTDESVEMAEGTNTNNINPAGIWRLAIGTTVLTRGTNSPSKNAMTPLDLRLHLTISCQPSASLADWKDVALL